ncbi:MULTISPECIES: DUF6087 family protein [Streptomyces]|uniref:DUF6087 family protein n=1 Tax=Streptomyces TaxID=1883 RepID=UPI001488B054|nr:MULTISPECIES: DUF6087 family protein [Streptomyces]
MDDEHLEEWAARREQSRPDEGERRATPLDGQPERASHVAPHAPRGIQEWDGHQWVPAGVAEDLPAAAGETGRDAQARAERVPLPKFSKLPPRPEPWRPTKVFRRPDSPQS